MKAEPEALTICLPGQSDDATDRARTITTSVPASSSTGVIDIGFTSCWVTVTTDQDIYIRSSTLNTIGAATTGDFPIWQKSYSQFWVDGERFVRAIGAGTAATLKFYVSNR